jgi:hypothetical protein
MFDPSILPRPFEVAVNVAPIPKPPPASADPAVYVVARFAVVASFADE